MKAHEDPARRQRLVDAALARMAAAGYEGATVRAIAKAAGITPGLLRYYFGDKGQLMAAAYRQFAAEAQAAAAEAAENAGPDPAERLAAFTRAALFLGDPGEGRLRTWVAFHELVITEPRVAAAQAEAGDGWISALGGCIADVLAERGEALDAATVRKLAIGAGAVLDGVRLECARNPSRMTPGEAHEIALSMIGARLERRAGS